MENGSLCHCGTVEEAVKVAEKLFVEMAASDCPVWAFQVGTALKTICIQHLAGSAGMSMLEVKLAANEIVRTTKRTMTPEAELADKGLEKGKALYGNA